MAEDPDISKAKAPQASVPKDFLPGFPALTDFSNEGLKRVAEATRAFQSLPPSGPLWDLQKSYPEFRRAMKNCRTKIEPLIKILLEHEMIPTHNYGRRNVEEKLEFLVEANDDILERVGTSLDDAEGLFKRAEMVIVDKSTTANSLKPPGTWGKKKFGSSSTGGDFRDAGQVSKKNPIIPVATLESRPTKKPVYRLRVTEKPQLKFADTIDNSLSPFIPKLNFKPNSLKPLSILPEYTANNEEFFGHPYELELNRFVVADWMMETSTPIPPKPLEETQLIYIDSADELDRMISELRDLKEIAVDLEHHSYRTFLGLTCLIQISTRDKDYIIDTLTLRREVEALNEIFTNSKIIKIFHGSTCDLEWLQRDFGVYVIGLFDTHLAMKQLNFTQFSLQHLLSHFCSIELDKKYQLADWRLRPLPEEMLTYARQDTHFLLFIYDLLKGQLLEQGNQNKNLLRAVYEHSRLACLKRYEKPGRNWQLALRKTRRNLNNRQIFAFTELYNWRDAVAREKDESLSFVLPNHMLLTIAETLPKEMTGILACCEPTPPLVHQYLGVLHRHINKARDLPVHEDKIEWTGPDKRKKQKDWMIVLNSIYDVDENTCVKIDTKVSNGEVDGLSCSDIVVRSSSTIPIGCRIFGQTNYSQKSTEYERYELSKNIMDILRNPTKKSNLNMDDPLVRVVRDTLMTDSVESDKNLTATVESSSKETLRRVLPEKDYVAFNPMGGSTKRKKKLQPLLVKSVEAEVVDQSAKEEDADAEVSIVTTVSSKSTEKQSKRQKRKGKFIEKMKWMKKGKKRRLDGNGGDEHKVSATPKTKGKGHPGSIQVKVEKSDTPTKKRRQEEVKKPGQRDRASRFFVNPFSTKAKEGKSITFKK